jgi:hypothetical protein
LSDLSSYDVGDSVNWGSKSGVEKFEIRVGEGVIKHVPYSRKSAILGGGFRDPDQQGAK